MSQAYRVLCRAPDSTPLHPITPQECHQLLIALWDLLSHQDREIRFEYVYDYLAGRGTAVNHEDLSIIAWRVTHRLEAIYEQLTEILELMGGVDVVNQVRVENVLGTTYVLRVAPHLEIEEV